MSESSDASNNTVTLATPTFPAPPPSVLAQIVALPNLPMPELKVLWQKLFGKSNTTHNRTFLERRIAHRLQEIEFRKQPEGRNLLDRNKRQIDTLIQVGKTKRSAGKVAFTPGTLLLREFREQEHQVIVGTDGSFEYRGQRFGSLSKIASDICGCAVSGPMFFGLKPRSRKLVAMGKKGAAR